MRTFKRFLQDASGATAVEYGLLVAGIAVSIIATISAIGGGLRNTLTDVSDNIGNAGQSQMSGSERVEKRVET